MIKEYRMGLKDITEKNLEDYADIFADIVNVLMFNGEEKVSQTQLIDAVKRGIYKIDDSTIHEQERDNAKYLVIDGVKVALIGLENQTNVDSFMPLRIIGYDGATYRKQVNELRDIIRKNKGCSSKQRLPLPDMYPVVTLVLYFGDTHWTAPKTIKECFSKSIFDNYISDYGINVFEIQYLSDETVSNFKSDFKYVAELFVQTRKFREGLIDKINLEPGSLLHSKEVLELLAVFTGSKDFEDAYNKSSKGDDVEMVTVMETYAESARREAKKEGIAIGRNEGIAIGRDEGIAVGRDEVNSLNQILIRDNRIDDLQRASSDPEYQKALIKELLHKDV